MLQSYLMNVVVLFIEFLKCLSEHLQNTLQREVFLKILVLGDLGVGKTSLVRRYANDNNEQSTPDYKVRIFLIEI